VFALPQISSCGIAFALPCMPGASCPHTEGSEHLLAFFSASSLFTLTAILAFSILERRGRTLIEGTIGTVYVLAGSVEHSIAGEESIRRARLAGPLERGKSSPSPMGI